jgi:hypothetical protein
MGCHGNDKNKPGKGARALGKGKNKVIILNTLLRNGFPAKMTFG